MQRAALLVAVVVASGLFAVSRGADRVFACSGPPTWQQMAMADAIFEGKVVSATEDAEQSDLTFRAFDVVLEVVVPHSGSMPGQQFLARARVPKPGIPVMCPQFNHDEQFVVGRYLVTSMHERAESGLILDAWSTPFIGDGPAGSEYELARAVAILAAGADQTAPSLEAQPSNPRCGEEVTLIGRRFPPSSAVNLSYPGMPGGSAAPLEVGADAIGAFSAHVFPDSAACGYELGFAEAWVGDPTTYGDRGIPLAAVRVPISAELAPHPPVAGNGLAIVARDRELPWNDIVMVVILVLAFSGGTVAIVRSTRRH